jgi:hypothetical protein
MHIQITWQELNERFGFELKAWKKKFHDYRMKQPSNADVVGVFFKFGNDRINPLLNEILGRSSGFPTFNRLVDYITKKH